MYLGFHGYTPMIVTVYKQWVQLWDPLLHNSGVNCHTRMIWLPWSLDFMLPCPLVQVLYTPQKSESPPFWNGWSCEIKDDGVKATFNGMASLLNFVKMYQLVENILVWDKQMNEQAGRLVIEQASLSFLKESLLKQRAGIWKKKSLEADSIQTKETWI